MLVSASELKSNLGHYLKLAGEEDILISKNGHPIARLTHPDPVRAERMRALFGILPNSVTIDEARTIKEERSCEHS